MLNTRQRILLKKLFRRINAKEICKDYGLSYQSVVGYVRGIHKYSQKQDDRIIEMLIKMQDDNFEMIEFLSRKLPKDD